MSQSRSSFKMTLVAATIVCCLLSSCTTEVSESTGSLPVGSTHSPRSPVDVSGALRIPPLPLDAYQLGPSESTAVDRATAILANQCMQRFGFASYPQPPSTAYTGLRTDTWGNGDPNLGYRTGFPPLTTAEQRAFDDYAAYLQAHPKTSNYESTYFGKVDRTKSVPTGTLPLGDTPPRYGCLGWAQSQIAPGDPSVGQPKLVLQLVRQSLTLLDAAPAKRRADLLWSQCMQQSGYRYANPQQPPADPAWESTDQPSKGEVATAVADHQCVIRTGYVSVWFRELTRIENSLIEDNALALAQVQTLVRQDLESATAILAHSN
jgi:hypothetical protein